MNTIKFSLLLIVVPMSSLLSQIDTTSLSFYPIQDGNYWQYHENTFVWWPYPFSYSRFYSIEIKGDTLMGNGQIYKILEKTYLDTFHHNFYTYERIDSISCNVYQYYFSIPQDEYLLDSLKSLAGDSSKASRGMFGNYDQGSYCDSLYEENILNILTTTKRIRLFELLHTEYHYLSSGFGLTHQFADFDFGYTTMDLVYARIEGIEYGQPVNIPAMRNSNIINSVILYPNYPNPFNLETTISFYIDTPQNVELSIYSIEGQLIEKVLLSKMNQGHHKLKWKGDNLSSGVYIYQLRADNYQESKKFILIK